MRGHTRARTTGVATVLIVAALCAGCSADQPAMSMEVRLMQGTPADSLTEMEMTVWGGHLTYYAHSEVLLTDADLITAKPVTNDGLPAIRLVFTEEARDKLYRITAHNVGGRIGIILNGKLQCADRIDAPVDTGVLMVTGHMLESKAKRYSRALMRAQERRTGLVASDEAHVPRGA